MAPVVTFGLFLVVVGLVGIAIASVALIVSEHRKRR